MKEKLILLLICFLFFGFKNTSAQDKKPSHEFFFVTLNDKHFNHYRLNQAAYFLSPKAIERRTQFNIKIDELDLPVSSNYIKKLKEMELEIMGVSRWLNGVLVKIPLDNIREIARVKQLFFVDTAVSVGFWFQEQKKSEEQNPIIADYLPEKTNFITLKQEDYGLAFEQIDMLKGVKFHHKGYTGKGITIALLDAGFFRADILDAFQYAFKNNLVIENYDFVEKEKNVFDDDDHGTQVWSCMAAVDPLSYIGTAPEANYLLYRTEFAPTEYPVEEIFWIMAAERADSLGADIINSSLGYSTFDKEHFNYSYDDLNGKTSFISRGAKIAAQKGIVVVSAAGNEGDEPWKYISCPADVNQILTIGAVTIDGNKADFSSFGHPDFEIKPDVMALGQMAALASSYGYYYQGNGTSFSTPIISGMIACLLQANKKASPFAIKNALKNSANNSFLPNREMGNGIPNFELAAAILGNQRFVNDLSNFNEVNTHNNKLQIKAHLNTTNSNKINIFVYKKKAFPLFGTYKKLQEIEGKTSNSFLIDEFELNKPIKKGKIEFYKEGSLLKAVEF